MANIIRIKRRASGGSGAPATLNSGELACNEVDGKLYYGKGNNGSGVATSIVVLGQEGAINGNETITLSGDATGSGTTGITVTLANSGVSAGTHTKVTVDAKGRVTSGTTLSASDIPTLTAAKISDFDTQVRTNRLDQMTAPTSSVAMNNQRLTGLATPTASTDAATKAYVDATKQGLDIKASVRVATQAALPAVTYANGAGTLTADANGDINDELIDGLTDLAVGDRILVKNQASGLQNGIYEVTTVGDGSNPFVLTRTEDADSGGASGDITSGLFTFVEEGTASASSGWVLATNGTITLGTTAMTFVQFSGAGQITAGDALTKTGNTLNVAVDSSSIEISSDALRVKAGGITNAMLAGSIDLTAKVTGVLPVANGGTNLSSYTAGDMVYASGTTTLSKLAAGTAGQVLVMNSGATAPEWADGLDGGSF